MSQVASFWGVQLAWMARSLSHRWGWLPIVCIVLCGVTAIKLAQQAAENKHQSETLQARLQQLAQQANTQQRASVTPPAVTTANQPLSEEASMTHMLAQMPAVETLSTRMLQISGLAHQYHIPLNVGDYQWQPATTYPASHVQQFDMRFMIQADYLTCRRFVAAVLQRYPDMALSGLELRKNETVQPTVEATLTFAVLMRGTDASQR